MKVRKHTVLFPAVCLLLIAAVVSGCSSKPAEKAAQKPAEGPIKIGAALALTGGSAEQGNRARRGALLAIEEANQAGGINGRKIELVEMDDRADPKEAANVANRLAADPSVVAVIGHTNSSCTLAGAPIYNKAGLVHITCSSSSPKISDAGPYTFRVWNSDAYTASFNVKKIIELGYKKIAIIYENNDYGRGGYDVAKKTLEEAGIQPVAAESYLLGETKDFSTIITKLKNAGAEAIYGVSDETEIPLFLKQAHQMGYKPFFVSSGTYNPAVIRLGGQDVEGAVGNALFNPEDPKPSLKAFFDKYLERFKSEGVTGTDPVSPAAYDATRMIIEALKKGGTTREAVKDYLTNLKDFDGVLGKLSFDKNGDTFIPMIYMTIKDGKFVEFKK
ncbi:MAG TPA: branched-chain amino acid ABC transporter substrate-binding protein [Firmicutes bacterium]|nr:branched-chain amino acid ABC transporter substrate-binding protein [Bacillota bacterium]